MVFTAVSLPDVPRGKRDDGLADLCLDAGHLAFAAAGKQRGFLSAEVRVAVETPERELLRLEVSVELRFHERVREKGVGDVEDLVFQRLPLGGSFGSIGRLPCRAFALDIPLVRILHLLPEKVLENPDGPVDEERVVGEVPGLVRPVDAVRPDVLEELREDLFGDRKRPVSLCERLRRPFAVGVVEPVAERRVPMPVVPELRQRRRCIWCCTFSNRTRWNRMRRV